MNNAARNFDRLAYIDTLKEAGIDEGSARAHANALDAAMRDGLATKQDIAVIDRGFISVERRFDSMDRKFEAVDLRFEAIDNKLEIIDQKFDAIDRRFDATDEKIDALDKKIATVESTLRREIQGVETTLRAEIKASEATLRAEIWQGTNRTVIWLVGTMIALSGIVLAIVRFAH
jgi:hypothetical protein